MTIFLILAPYGVFAALMMVTSAAVSLFAGAAICLMVIAFDIIRGRAVKMLGAGSAVVFAVTGFYVTLIDPALGKSAVKFAVDAGIFLVSLVSIVIRHPFTLQYALEAVDPDTARLPGFMRANYIITWAWTAAALLMMMGNVAIIYLPWLPLWSGTSRRLRRPQQRRLFHQVVSGVPQGQLCEFPRRGAARYPLRPTFEWERDEGRIRQARYRLPFRHRVPGAVSGDRQCGACDVGGDRRRRGAGHLRPRQGDGRWAS